MLAALANACLADIEEPYIEGTSSPNHRLTSRLKSSSRILPETDLDGALVVASRIEQRVRGLHIEHADSDVCNAVTLSVRVAVCVPEPEGDPLRLLGLADVQLYEAKRSGRPWPVLRRADDLHRQRAAAQFDFDALIAGSNFRRRSNGYRHELALHHVDCGRALASQLAPPVQDVRVDAVRHRYLRDRCARRVALGQDLRLQLRAVPPALVTQFDFHRVQLFVNRPRNVGHR